jgi:hypothetical protein
MQLGKTAQARLPGQDCRARLPGKTAGQDCRARLTGKTARARLPGKTAGQDCRARLPGKTAGQDCQARLPGKSQQAGGPIDRPADYFTIPDNKNNSKAKCRPCGILRIVAGEK